jgi:hypothetical protein
MAPKKQPGKAAGGASSPPGALDPQSEATVVGDIWKAVSDLISGASQVEQIVNHEFSQLIEDLHSYYVQYRSGQLNKRDAQFLITQRRSQVPAILALRAGLQANLAQQITNDGIKAIQEAFNTVLAAAFSGFKFAL